MDNYDDFMDDNDVDLILAKHKIENVNKGLEIFLKPNSDEVSHTLFYYDKDLKRHNNINYLFIKVLIK